MSENKQEVFLYAVHPKRAITGIPGIQVIRVPKSVYLTKDDVYTCLKKASVYRRFSGTDAKNERVTADNVDRLHRAEYISEEDWPAFLAAEKSKGHGTVQAPQQVPEENKDNEENKIDESATTTQVAENKETIEEKQDGTSTENKADESPAQIDQSNNADIQEEVNGNVTELNSDNENEAKETNPELNTAVENNDVEQSTENKEDEKVESSKQDQKNANQHQYNNSKKNNKR